MSTGTNARSLMRSRRSVMLSPTGCSTRIYLGERLGLYRALATSGPLTVAEQAAAAAINQRYTREWLEQRAVADA
jgi:hypothetical protein